MTTKLVPSAPLFSQAIEAIKAVQESPLSAFNIHIDRHPSDITAPGEKPSVDYTIKRPDKSGVTVIIHTRNGQVTNMLLSRVIQLDGWQGPCTLSAHWSPLDIWNLKITEVGTVGSDEWSPALNGDGLLYKTPPQSTYNQIRASLINVAQRMHQRLLRVDLL